jgi:hypothetical protein
MSDPADETELERQILTELARIERNIVSLRAESDALQRTLSRVRQQRLGSLTTSRRNSHARILAESEIVAALKNADQKTLTTGQLLKLEAAINPGLNATTFRSHLHRMKKKGLIVPKSGQRGVWTLPVALRV